MANLSTTITPRTEDDYDGVPQNTKEITGSIDDGSLTEGEEILSCASTETDADVITAYKTRLTSLGYTWTN